jgi:MinD superfamily P-loop ATPase
MVVVPQIDQEKCDGCGLCVGVCLRLCLVLVDDVITLVETVDCDWCTLCEAVCPRGAICCPFEIVIKE